MRAAQDLAQEVGTAGACRALGVSRASLYRRHRHLSAVPMGSGQAGEKGPIRAREYPSCRALSEPERREALTILNSERFMDQTPYEVYGRLLDEGRYYCSIRTMYRLLEQETQVRPRRDQLRHARVAKPQLVATGPNQVWTWDITKLKGPMKWSYYYLYVILDLFSRYVVGWMVAHREAAILAKRLIEQTCQREGIVPGQLTVHADRGPSMTSKGVSELLVDLGILRSHSRPHVSNDNPFSESQFKTMKYRPDFPDRFGSIQDTRGFCRGFFGWYHHEHRHTGIGLMTPEQVYRGLAKEVTESRRRVLEAAYQAHPERFVRKPPMPPVLPEAVWINRPETMGGLLVN